MRNIRYAPNSAAIGIVSNANRRAKRAAQAERRGLGLPTWVNITIAIAAVVIGLLIV